MKTKEFIEKWKPKLEPIFKEVEGLTGDEFKEWILKNHEKCSVILTAFLDLMVKESSF